LPHLQDTGGFFVTVLEKIKPLPQEKITNNIETEINEIPVNSTRKPKKSRYQGYKEDPFEFLNNDDPVWPEIRLFIKILNNLL